MASDSFRGVFRVSDPDPESRTSTRRSVTDEPQGVALLGRKIDFRNVVRNGLLADSSPNLKKSRKEGLTGDQSFRIFALPHGVGVRRKAEFDGKTS